LYSPERLSQAFLRALPFGVSNTIRLSPVLLTTACRHAEGDPAIGSDELGAAGARTPYFASLNLKQE
jgi:hypothetical protein